MKPKEFKEGCFGFRSDIELLKKQVKNWMSHPVFDDLPKDADPMEMAPNLLLAYRHLEDARMRIGKAIQAYDGGKSVYPR